MCDTQSQIKSDPGYLPDDHDNEVSVPKTKLPPPACFKTCLQCLKENSNPYFQYCHTCFKVSNKMLNIFFQRYITSNKEGKS